MRDMTTVQAVDHHAAKLSPRPSIRTTSNVPLIQLGRWRHAWIHHR